MRPCGGIEDIGPRLRPLVPEDIPRPTDKLIPQMGREDDLELPVFLPAHSLRESFAPAAVNDETAFR